MLPLSTPHDPVTLVPVFQVLLHHAPSDFLEFLPSLQPAGMRKHTCAQSFQRIVVYTPAVQHADCLAGPWNIEGADALIPRAAPLKDMHVHPLHL